MYLFGINGLSKESLDNLLLVSVHICEKCCSAVAKMASSLKLK